MANNKIADALRRHANNNPNFPPNRRLSEDVIKAILLSTAHPAVTAHTLTHRYGIVCSASTVRKIRSGARHGKLFPEIARVPRLRRRRWQKRPVYITENRNRLRKGYALVPEELAS